MGKYSSLCQHRIHRTIWYWFPLLSDTRRDLSRKGTTYKSELEGEIGIRIHNEPEDSATIVHQTEHKEIHRSSHNINF